MYVCYQQCAAESFALNTEQFLLQYSGVELAFNEKRVIKLPRVAVCQPSHTGLNTSSLILHAVHPSSRMNLQILLEKYRL